MKRLWIVFGLVMIIIMSLAEPSVVFGQDGGLSISAARMMEVAFEIKSPKYKVLSDKNRLASLANTAVKHGGFDKALLLLVTAIAERGNAEAEYMVGMIYALPDWISADSEIKQDRAWAHNWFIKAAKKGHRSASVQAADDLFFGDGVAKDHNKALRYYETAAKANDPYAQRMSGVIYITEVGIQSGKEQDFRKGIDWLKKAADNGDKRAKHLLSRMLGEVKQVPSKKRKEESLPPWLMPVTTE